MGPIILQPLLCKLGDCIGERDAQPQRNERECSFKGGMIVDNNFTVLKVLRRTCVGVKTLKLPVVIRCKSEVFPALSRPKKERMRECNGQQRERQEKVKRKKKRKKMKNPQLYCNRYCKLQA